MLGRSYAWTWEEMRDVVAADGDDAGMLVVAMVRGLDLSLWLGKLK